MAFHDERFPDKISRGARGGPRRRTQIVALQSGHEERNASWADSRREFDVAYGIRNADDIAAVVAFFEAVNGMLDAFRFKDWADYKSCLPSGTVSATDQVLGSGDDTETDFQLRKAYNSGSRTYWRTITRPVSGTVKVALDGVEAGSGWSVDLSTGIVTFDTAPGSGVEVTAGFEFDVPARFDTDMIDEVRDIERNGSIASIPLKEVREA